MLRYFLFFGFIITYFGLSFQASSPDSDSYIAAVVQYNPVMNGKNGKEILAANVKEYMKIIEIAAKNEVDIVVFPEHGLTNVPDADVIDDFYNTSDSADYGNEDNLILRHYFYELASLLVPHPTIVPCLGKSLATQSIKNISCAARKYQIYVVINHYERVSCNKGGPDCPLDGFLLYNTNVVFNRNGSIIARYRKRFLYDEPWADEGEYPQESGFRTDFEVSFDQLIGTDILHKQKKMILSGHSLLDYAEEIVYSTRKIVGFSFINSVQNQAVWASHYKVNLLAAGFSNDGGSNIYIGKSGPINGFMLDLSTNLMVIAKVPKKSYKDDLDPQSIPYRIQELDKKRVSEPFIGDSWVRSYLADQNTLIEKVPVKLEQQVQVSKLCYFSFCCEFSLEVKFNMKIGKEPNATFYRYWLVAFQAGFELGFDPVHKIEVCAVIACPGIDFSECRNTPADNVKVSHATTFKFLRIARIVNQKKNDLFNPLATKKDNFLRLNEDFDYYDVGYYNVTLLQLNIKRDLSDIMVLGICGQRALAIDKLAEIITTTPSPQPEPNFDFYDFFSIGLIIFIISFVSFLIIGGTSYYFYMRKQLTVDFGVQFNVPAPTEEGPPPYS